MCFQTPENLLTCCLDQVAVDSWDGNGWNNFPTTGSHCGATAALVEQRSRQPVK